MRPVRLLSLVTVLLLAACDREMTAPAPPTAATAPSGAAFNTSPLNLTANACGDAGTAFVGTTGNDLIFFNGVVGQLTMTLVNPYSGEELLIDAEYNVNQVPMTAWLDSTLCS